MLERDRRTQHPLRIVHGARVTLAALSLLIVAGCPTTPESDGGPFDGHTTTPDAGDAASVDAASFDASFDAPSSTMDSPVVLDADSAVPPDGAPSDAWAPPSSDAGMPTGPRLLALTAGAYHTCALDSEHRVWCWGRNTVGQIGVGALSPEEIRPRRVASWTDVERLDAGHAVTCAVRGGELWCWGEHALFGSTPQPTPTRLAISLPAPITSLSVSSLHVCAVAADGTHCWGEGLGALGSDGVAPIAELAGTVSLVGFMHTCALDAVGNARCWGVNNGAIGDGTTLDRRRPTAVMGGPFRELRTAFMATCGIGFDDVAYCWGSDSYDRLGNPAVTEQLVPTEVVGGPYRVVSPGYFHTAAILETGGVVEWGLSRTPPYEPVIVPRAVSSSLTAVDVVTGDNHICMLTTHGQAYCFGYGGHLGGDGSTSAVPVLVQFPCTSSADCDVGEICNAAGECEEPPPMSPDAGVVDGARVVDFHWGCAVHASGEVYCFEGYLGDGSAPVSSAAPRRVDAIANGASVTRSLEGHCVLGTLGEVWCWGLNSVGEVGDGTLDERRRPVRIDSLPTIVALEGFPRGQGGYGAVTADGRVMVWGDDSADFARSGSATMRPLPTAVMGLTNVIDIASITARMCALTSSGVVRCWSGGSAPIEDLWTDPTAVEVVMSFDGTVCTRGSEVRCDGVVMAGFRDARSINMFSGRLVTVDAAGDTFVESALVSALPAASRAVAHVMQYTVITTTGEVWTSPFGGPARRVPTF